MTSPTKPALKFVLGIRGKVAVYSNQLHIGDIYKDSFSATTNVFLDELKAIIAYIETHA